MTCSSVIFGYNMFLFILLQILIPNLTSLHAALRDQSSIDLQTDYTGDLIVHLIKKCFLHDDSTVGLIGDVPEDLAKKLHLSEIVTTTSVGDLRSTPAGDYGKIPNSKSLYRELFWIKMQRIVHTFVVTAPSQSVLDLTLEMAKTSVWWNSAAFFIVTSTFENNNCRNAFSYLWTLWQRGILHSVFLCEDNETLAAYAYSPYYNGHTKSWQTVKVHSGPAGHPWTMIKLDQVYDVNICETLTFDKVERLNGHPIFIGVLQIPPTLLIHRDGKTWFDKHVGEDATIIHTIWKALNGSTKETYYGGIDPIGFAGKNGTYTGFMADVSLGRVDHGMNSLHTNIHWRIKSAYPHAASSVHFLSASKGTIPTWLKFLTVYEIPVTIAIQATLLAAIMFTRYIDHRPWSSAILEVLRVSLSTSMLRLPIRLSGRFFFTTLFVMVLVTTSGFQGQLVSLLTKPTSYRDIDGIDDLLASGYPAYGYPPFKAFFDGTKVSDQFRDTDRLRLCLDAVDQGHPVVCVSEYMHLKSITMSTLGCHMSKEPVAPFYTAYLTRIDWPLFDRFNLIVQRLFNSGITGYWRNFYLDDIERKNWAKMRSVLTPNLKVLSLANLTVVFRMLMVGWTLSFSVFVVEIISSCVNRASN